MAITLDHTIVPARDKQAAARFFADVFGLRVEPPLGRFAPVRVNETLTLDFADATSFEPHHYAFRVGKDGFDAIFGRVRQAGITYTADPPGQQVGQIYHRGGTRGFYFRDPNGHVLEVLAGP